MKLKRLVGWALVLLVVFILFMAMRPKPLPADIATVEVGRLRVTIEEEGKTRVRDRFVVSAPVAGRVLRVRLKPGDPVRAGRTIVASFLPADPVPLDVRSWKEAESRVRAAQAELGRAGTVRRQAAAALEFAQSELGRYQALEKKGVISKEKLETLKVEAQMKEESLRAAEYSVASARHKLEMARASLLQTSQATVSSDPPGGSRRPVFLRSPVDGVVLRRLRESESVVPAGTPILEVGDPTDLEIVSDLLSTEAVKIGVGDKVLIEQWGDNRTLPGRVRLIEPSGFTKISALGVEEQRVNVIIDFEGPKANWSDLGDGYHVQVRIIIWEGAEVLTVPTGSLFRHQDAWAVFVVESGQAQVRPVEIGHRSGLLAEVLSGLEEGEELIVYPSDSIHDGAAVNPRSP